MNPIPEPYEKRFINGIKHPKLYLWDAWSFVENDTIHLYCLAVSRIKPDGSEMHPNERNSFPFHIRHFTSTDDAISWKDEGCFLKIRDIPNLGYATIWSGSIEPIADGRKMVAFTGLIDKDADHQFLQNIAIGISETGFKLNHLHTSTISSPIIDYDHITEMGYYFDKKENLGGTFGEENGPIMAWRDPYVFRDTDNMLHLFWAAKIGPRVGAVAQASLKVVENTIQIGELYPPVTVPDIDEFTQLELPKVLYDETKQRYYLIVASCNRLYETQPDSEIKKEVRLYSSKNIDGPWISLGNSILGKENMFGITVLKPDFENDRLLCMAPYTELASNEEMLTFRKAFYIYLNPLKVDFIQKDSLKI